MNSIWLVATNTLRQTIRQRLFLNVAVFGVGLVLLSVVVSQLTLGYANRVVRAMGLSGVTIALDLLALLVAVSLVHAEIDKKTLFVVLARPVSRASYILGRFLGLVFVLALALVGFSAVFALALGVTGDSPTGLDALALLFALPEAAILGAFGLVLSAFSTPTLSAGLGLGFWIASATTDDLVKLTVQSDPLTKGVAQFVYYALPSLARFDFRENAVYGISVAASDVAGCFSYAGVYICGLVGLACLIMMRREML